MVTFMVGSSLEVEQFDEPVHPLWKHRGHTVLLRVGTHVTEQVEGSLAAQIPHRGQGIHVVFRPEELRKLAHRLEELGFLDPPEAP